MNKDKAMGEWILGKEGIELTESILGEEISRVKLVLGWLIVNNNDCLERAYLKEMLKKRFDKLLDKQKEIKQGKEKA